MNTNPFHISEAASQEMLNDFQHEVERQIELYGHKEDFPNMERFHIGQQALDDYLFDKQAILDSGGTERSRYTLAGILIVIPIVLLALFYPVNEMPWGSWSLPLAALAGVVLWLIVYGLQKFLIRFRLQRLDGQHADVRQYVDAVLKYGQKQ
ncbi:MAG: hypothetical protein IJV27_09115 [Prevotella sp.]|nr:hypothetical protein [Prevotella sp.]